MKNESALSIEIFGKNYTVSDGLTNMTLKKCSKLDNYFKDDENAKVNFTVTLEGDTYTTDLVVSSRGITYRATAVSDSPYTNLDLVIPKLLGQVRKQKDIWERRGIAVDKKKAKKGSWRIKESTLLTMGLIGGSIGGIAGMYTFRHKTQKPRFVILFPIMLILQIIIAVYIITK